MSLKKLGLLGLLCVCVLYSYTTSAAESEEEYSETIGKFKYTYCNYASDQIWITLIEPVSDQGISILKIPSKIGGKKVTKLGSKYDNDQEYREYNIFGFWVSENDGKLKPKKMINRVEKIKNIVIPKTVIDVTPNSFTKLQNGKKINIPKGITQNITNFCEVRWKKFSVSSKNKKYKVEDGVLLSKDGKLAYGSVMPMKKLSIPRGVKTIEDKSIFYSSGATDFYIPASVNKIGFQSFFLIM